MFKRLLHWFQKEPDVIAEPEPWPEDIWLRMYAMAQAAESWTLDQLSVVHFDAMVDVTTSSIHQLFRRIEVMISCIDIQSDTPSWWDDRNRDKQPVSLAEYYYDKRFGYHEPQDVLTKLIEKVAVIHYQIDTQRINVSHEYHSYMRREFFQIVSDIVEVLTASHELAKPAQ